MDTAWRGERSHKSSAMRKSLVASGRFSDEGEKQVTSCPGGISSSSPCRAHCLLPVSPAMDPKGDGLESSLRAPSAPAGPQE